MSGFEAIGVVLAVWPLVVNGIQVYKLARSGQGWDLLYDQFVTEQVIYQECVLHLLAPELSESDLAQLIQGDKPNGPLLKDPAVTRGLEGRLGQQKSQIVLKTIQSMDSLLQLLKEKMQSHEIPLDAPHQRLRAGIRHIKVLQEKIKADLKQLMQYNETLRRLLFNPSSYGYQSQSKIPKSSPNLPPYVLKRIAAQANELHDAICEGYNCDCRHPHEANLGALSVNDFELKEPFELVFPVSGNEAVELVSQDPASPISLESQFDSMSIFSSRRWSHRGSIDTLPTSLGSGFPSPPLRSHAFSFSQCSGMEDGGLIDDLCQFIRRLGDSTPAAAPASCLGVLGVKKKKYKVKVTSLDGESAEPDLVCLDDYLSPMHKGEVTRKKRMDLALGLSLAILQFYATPWIDMWWTWKDFCVLKGDKSQIYVTKRFYSNHNPILTQGPGNTTTHSLSASAFWDLIGEPVLTRLGFALVELALGRRLSELRNGGHSAIEEEDMLDLMLARELVESGRVRDESSQCYNDAVKACLMHQVMMETGVKALTSKHGDFQLDVERYVVAPIRDNFASSWGQVAVG